MQIEADYDRAVQRREPRKPLSSVLDPSKLSTLEMIRLFIDGFDATMICNVCHRALCGHIHVNCDRALEARR